MKALHHRHHLPHLRKAVQSSFALFCLWAGWRFYHFHQWAIGQSETYTPRPPSVEGFLPISALMGLKKLALTGMYDSIHPAGLTIFIAAIIISLFFRKSFCGWICPVGFTSQLAQLTGTKIHTLFKPPYWAAVPWMIIKYILLFSFIFMIVIKMNIQSIESFIQAPYNITVDARMLNFFLDPSRLAGTILLFLFIISFIIKNFWCRFLCPYGAMLGIFALCSPLSIHRDGALCIDCKKCDKVCPGEIEVSHAFRVASPECIGCLECIAHCPKDACLSVGLPGETQVHVLLLPLLTVSTFLLFWFIARSTGHWHSSIPLDLLQKYYQLGATTLHP